MTEPMARIEAALARLGADREPPVGWEARVMAATATRRRSRWWWIGAPIAVLGGLALALWARPAREAQLALAIVVDGGPLVRASDASAAAGATIAHAGQLVHVTASGGSDHRVVWIYREGKLVVACPVGAACHGSDRADLALTAIGNYTVVALSARAPLPSPTGAFDSDVAAALSAGACWARAELAVR